MNMPAAVGRHNKEKIMAWTIDARCSKCGKKPECEDRKKLIGTLSPLTNELNTSEQYTEGPGDGILIIACNDFVVG